MSETPLSIWHPFTQDALDPRPIFIDRAEGVYLYTPDGRRLLEVRVAADPVAHDRDGPALRRRLDAERGGHAEAHRRVIDRREKRHIRHARGDEKAIAEIRRDRQYARRRRQTAQRIHDKFGQPIVAGAIDGATAGRFSSV